ncbi:hypothetical protein BDW71DRAFT_109831 [Aspergillus fruticulosus]
MDQTHGVMVDSRPTFRTFGLSILGFGSQIILLKARLFKAQIHMTLCPNRSDECLCFNEPHRAELYVPRQIQCRNDITTGLGLTPKLKPYPRPLAATQKSSLRALIRGSRQKVSRACCQSGLFVPSFRTPAPGIASGNPRQPGPLTWNAQSFQSKFVPTFLNTECFKLVTISKVVHYIDPSMAWVAAQTPT